MIFFTDPKKTVRFLSYLIKLVEVKAMTDPVVNDLRKQQVSKVKTDKHLCEISVIAPNC